jgi:hypothetical protein
MIPITKPVLGEPEAEAARRVILSGWTSQGPEVAAFEREFAAFVGAPHACAVSNCTTALHLALLAVGIGPGDEVITVSHSFIATANAVRYCGVKRDTDCAIHETLPLCLLPWNLRTRQLNRYHHSVRDMSVHQMWTPRQKCLLCGKSCR